MRRRTAVIVAMAAMICALVALDPVTVSASVTVDGLEIEARTPTIAGITCANWYRTQDVVYGGWLLLAKANVNVGMCWDGSRVWASWGPDCGVWTPPWIGSEVTWCGVWNNGGNRADPGSNWYYYEYHVPWHHYGHWMRFELYSNGSSTGVWGN